MKKNVRVYRSKGSETRSHEKQWHNLKARRGQILQNISKHRVKKKHSVDSPVNLPCPFLHLVNMSSV